MHRDLVRNYHSHEGRGQTPATFPMFNEPAYSVLPFVRAPVGFGHTGPRGAIMRGALVIFGPLALWFLWVGFTGRPMPANAGHVYLIYFVAFCVAVNCLVWARRFIDMRRGRDIHELEAGYSWVAWYLPVPAWLAEIILVPGLFVLVGWYAFGTFSRDLGAWLIICGLSLAHMALWELRRRIAAGFAVANIKVQGQTSAWWFEDNERRASRQGQQGKAARDFAEMASGPPEPPDAMMMQPGSDSLTPGRAVWFRKWRTAAKRGQGREHPRRDYAEPGE